MLASGSIAREPTAIGQEVLVRASETSTYEGEAGHRSELSSIKLNLFLVRLRLPRPADQQEIWPGWRRGGCQRDRPPDDNRTHVGEWWVHDNCTLCAGFRGKEGCRGINSVMDWCPMKYVLLLLADY